jgi:hypothetical protein
MSRSFVGIFPTETVPYVSRYDRSAHPTVFHLGQLSVAVYEGLMNRSLHLASTGGMSLSRSRNVEAVRYGLVRVENFYDGSGTEIEITREQTCLGGHAGYPYLVCSDTFLGYVPVEVLDEVGDVIVQINTLTEAEAYNLRLSVFVGQEWKDHRCSELDERQRRNYGCDGERAPAPVLFFEGEDVWQCPVSLITVQSMLYMRWYNHYKNNNLPQPGGLMNQSNKLIQAFEEIDSAVSRYTQDLQKKQEELAKSRKW